MYFSGSGTNQLVFRGTAQTNAATGFLAFNGEGVGETGIVTGINFNGTANMEEEDGSSGLSIRLEAGTAAAGTFGGKLIANGSAATVMTVNGALSGSTTLVVDGVSGATLAVGQVITVKSTDTASISDADSNTGISTDNSLTITAVASQTSVTVSEPITVANDIVLLASTNGGEEMIVDALGFKVAGPTYASRSDITTITRIGADDSVAIALEEGTEDLDGEATHISDGRLVQESGNAASNNSDGRNIEGKGTVFTDPYVVETAINDAATFSQSGTTSGSANILKGVDVASS
jgi:hypothetical protein